MPLLSSSTKRSLSYQSALRDNFADKMPREDEGFVVPASPSKRRGQRSAAVLAPESPDMKNARNRLGNLLNGIQRGDIAPTGTSIAEPL